MFVFIGDMSFCFILWFNVLLFVVVRIFKDFFIIEFYKFMFFFLVICLDIDFFLFVFEGFLIVEILLGMTVSWYFDLLNFLFLFVLFVDGLYFLLLLLFFLLLFFSFYYFKG